MADTFWTWKNPLLWIAGAVGVIALASSGKKKKILPPRVGNPAGFMGMPDFKGNYLLQRGVMKESTDMVLNPIWGENGPYAGWPNMATWNVAMWLGQDEFVEQQLRHKNKKFTAESAERYVKSYFPVGTPDFSDGPLSYKIVDWGRIAEALNERIHQDNPKKIDKRVALLRKKADSLQKEIDNKRHPAIAGQNLTARRARIAAGMAKDADHLEKIQHVLRGMADDIEKKKLPAALEGVQSKAMIGGMIYGWYPNYENFFKTKEEFEAAREAIQKYMKGPPAEVIELQKKRALESDLIGTKIPGFFPSPPAVVDELLQLARPISPGMKVLEPSAGKGDIADAVRLRFPGVKLTLVERMWKLCEILKLKGYQPICADFMEYQGYLDQPFDRIIMNPPFEKGQDVDHVRHAYDLLAPGGRLVSVMGAHPFFGSDKKSEQFRWWLQNTVRGKIYDMPQGSFTGAKSFRQTGTNVKIVIIDKAPVTSNPRRIIVDSLGPCHMGFNYQSNPRSLLSPGNEKLGNIANWSLPASRTKYSGRTFITCPGQSAWCRTHCYAQKGRFEFGAVKEKYHWNLLQTFHPDFVQKMVDELHKSSSRYIRIHVSGDFYSIPYINKWHEIVKACPEHRFYAYTRVWRNPRLRQSVLKLNDLPNFTLLASTDVSTGPAPAGWKEAGIDNPYHKDATLCRHQETGITCEQCLLCWQKRGHVWFKFH